jgi:hypothetical protein
MLHPFDLVLISCVKDKYSKALVQNIMAALGRKAELKLNGLQAILPCNGNMEFCEF